MKKKKKDNLKKAIFAFIFLFNNHIIPSSNFDPVIYSYINTNSHNQQNEQSSNMNFDTRTFINGQEEGITGDAPAFVAQQNEANIPCLIEKTKALMAEIKETRCQQELLKGEEKKTIEKIQNKYKTLKNKEAKLTEEINLDTVTILKEEVKKEKKKLEKIKENYRKIQINIKAKISGLELSIEQKKKILNNIKNQTKPISQCNID